LVSAAKIGFSLTYIFLVASAMSSMGLGALKKQIRVDIKAALALYTQERVASESAQCCVRVLTSAQYQSSSAISVYLSMPQEVQTDRIISAAIADGKRVFIPKILGPKPKDMVMVEIASLEEVERFPKSKWVSIWRLTTGYFNAI